MTCLISYTHCNGYQRRHHDDIWNKSWVGKHTAADKPPRLFHDQLGALLELQRGRPVRRRK